VLDLDSQRMVYEELPTKQNPDPGPKNLSSFLPDTLIRQTYLWAAEILGIKVSGVLELDVADRHALTELEQLAETMSLPKKGLKMIYDKVWRATALLSLCHSVRCSTSRWSG
jgi:hypothetical protein